MNPAAVTAFAVAGAAAAGLVTLWCLDADLFLPGGPRRDWHRNAAVVLAVIFVVALGAGFSALGRSSCQDMNLRRVRAALCSGESSNLGRPAVLPTVAARGGPFGARPGTQGPGRGPRPGTRGASGRRSCGRGCRAMLPGLAYLPFTYVRAGAVRRLTYVPGGLVSRQGAARRAGRRGGAALCSGEIAVGGGGSSTRSPDVPAPPRGPVEEHLLGGGLNGAPGSRSGFALALR